MPVDKGSSPENLRQEFQRIEKLLMASEAMLRQLRDSVDRLTTVLDKHSPPTEE
jgi:hypothetical protein